MPVNLQELQTQIQGIGQQALQSQAILKDRYDQASQLLEANAHDLQYLRDRVKRAAIQNQSLRCAVPSDELLNVSFPLPGLNPSPVIVAADGSQIVPSRHDAVEFGMINLGGIIMVKGSNIAPETITRSLIYYFDPVSEPLQQLSEETINMHRDVSERKLLVELAKDQLLPVIALSDGPLELYREPKSGKDYQEAFLDYLSALEQLTNMNVIVAGYVDKPRANMLVQLLELLILEDVDLPHAGRDKKPLSGVADSTLLEGLIPPGERSAIFGLQSRSSNSYHEFNTKLGLHFFYLNVGFGNMNWLVRVEIPAWVANEKEFVDVLHVALINQCRILGTKPYPYVLQRAHEIALVSMEDKERVMQMIDTEIRQRGLSAGVKSHKQAIKDIAGVRVRYES